MLKRVEEAVASIRRVTSQHPRAAAVLGSGLSSAIDVDDERVEMDYTQIAHWPRSGVEGHAGKLVLGRVGGIPVALLKGRAHFYEGWGMEEVAFPIRVVRALGAASMVLTAAVGSVHRGLRPGQIVALRDHINMMGVNPLRGAHEESLGARFVSLSDAYDEGLRRVARRVAKRHRIALREGVYVAMPGPSYETPAEVRMARLMGGHVIGMSTVPEVIVARQAGLRVLALVLVTNLAAGLAKRPLSHEEVIATGERVRPRLGALLREVLVEVDHA